MNSVASEASACSDQATNKRRISCDFVEAASERHASYLLICRPANCQIGSKRLPFERLVLRNKSYMATEEVAQIWFTMAPFRSTHDLPCIASIYHRETLPSLVLR